MRLCYQPKKLHIDASASKAGSANVEQQSALLQDFTCVKPKEANHPAEAECTDSDDDTSYTVGKFVIVNYDDRPYVGQIMKICHNEAEINCMKQVGDKNNFIWPNTRLYILQLWSNSLHNIWARTSSQVYQALSDWLAEV